MTTRQQARDELSALVSQALTGRDVVIIWDSDAEEVPKQGGAWCRVTIRHVDNTQRTLGDYNGQRRWKSTGLIFVQLFCPFGDGLSLEDELSMLLVNSLRGVTTSSGVMVRKARAQEIGRDGYYHQTNVTAEFEYDEVE